MSSLVRLCIVGLLLAISVIGTVAAAPPPSTVSTELGSPYFHPTPEQPVGWRGDGTGRYPGATPPTTWEMRRNGSAFAAKGMLWGQPLPSTTVSSPIIVGDRIFLTSEPTDLMCLDKKSGRILWIRSNSEVEALSSEELKEDPAYIQQIAPLVMQLAKANADVVDALNAQVPLASAEQVRGPVLKRKQDIEKKIADGLKEIDKKKFERYWAQVSFGFAGPTPTSDGKHVCAFFTTGVACCYDLNGNRKWIHRGSGGGSEHGNFASPVLCENQLVVWANELRSYDVETGKLMWTNSAKGSNTYGSLFRFRSGDDWVAAFQFGYFTRVRDGKPVWEQGAFGNSVATPIVEGDTIFAEYGYPRTNGQNVIFGEFKIPDSTDSGKMALGQKFKIEWGEDEIPVDKKKSPFDRGYVASPLFVDGLVYMLTQGGGLIVNDAATGDMVYRKVLGLHPKTEYWSWAGCSASPTLAGKYIYLMDNQGTTVVIQPGRTYEEIARNVVEEPSKDGQQAQNLATPVFEGTRLYYRTPGFLYCIGRK